MSDITLCTNKDCPLSFSCWRFNCPPNKAHQSYDSFKPQVDEFLDEAECKMYLQKPTHQ